MFDFKNLNKVNTNKPFPLFRSLSMVVVFVLSLANLKINCHEPELLLTTVLMFEVLTLHVLQLLIMEMVMSSLVFLLLLQQIR